MADSLTFELVPRGERLTFRALVQATDSINRILRDVDYALTGNKQGRQWLVARLSNPTPTIDLEPMLDEVGIIDATASGIQILTGDEPLTAPPAGWNELGLNDLRDMKRLFNGRYDMREVTVKRQARQIGRIADDIERRVNRVFRGGYSLLGSVEGRLERVNLHGQSPTITIWDRVTGKPVKVYLSKNLRGHAKGLLDQNVLAIGRVRYFANGMPRSIVDLTDIRDMTRPLHRRRAEYGSIPDLTGDQTVEDFLAGMRE